MIMDDRPIVLPNTGRDSYSLALDVATPGEYLVIAQFNATESTEGSAVSCQVQGGTLNFGVGSDALGVGVTTFIEERRVGTLITTDPGGAVRLDCGGIGAGPVTLTETTLIAVKLP